jgi:hypothetical protein
LCSRAQSPRPKIFPAEPECAGQVDSRSRFRQYLSNSFSLLREPARFDFSKVFLAGCVSRFDLCPRAGEFCANFFFLRAPGSAGDFSAFDSCAPVWICPAEISAPGHFLCAELEPVRSAHSYADRPGSVAVFLFRFVRRGLLILGYRWRFLRLVEPPSSRILVLWPARVLPARLQL